VTLLGQGVGLGDPQRTLPTPTMLGFCDSLNSSAKLKLLPFFTHLLLPLKRNPKPTIKAHSHKFRCKMKFFILCLLKHFKCTS